MSGAVYRFDLGKNRFYTLAIGETTGRNEFGLKIVEDPIFESDPIGPLPESALGRGVIDISRHASDRKAKFVQIKSYAHRNRTGPAFSSVIRVNRIIGEREQLEPLALSLNQDATMLASHVGSTPKAFPYRESHLSEPMFLGALTGMLPTLLPAVGNIVGGLFGGGGGGRGGGAAAPPAAANPLAALTSPEMIQQIMQLIGQISGNSAAGAAGAAPVTPAAEAQAIAFARSFSQHPNAAPASGEPALSEAQVAPALLAALPALMPILQQVLTPETVQSLVDAPTKHVGTLINGAKDIAKIGIESAEQDLRHLRELNPGVNDPALDALLASMSLGINEMTREPTYRRVPSVRLDFTDVNSTRLFGRTVVPYHYGRDLAFPIKIDTPRAIGKSVLDLTIKNADTLEILYRKRYRFDKLTTGQLPVVAEVKAGQAAKLQNNGSYIVCATVMWKNKAGKKRGTSIQQQILLAGAYSFDRVEESSDLMPLVDAQRYRAFWHKVWEGRFTKTTKRIDAQFKYYYVLNPENVENARLETVNNLASEDGRRTGAMKSGMELSLQTLNEIIPSLDSKLNPLDDEQLSALTRDDFSDRFNQSAQYRIRLRGRPEDTGAVWVYPEVKLQTVVLKKAAATNGNGNIVSFDDHPVRFPMPSLVHVIGVRSE